VCLRSDAAPHVAELKRMYVRSRYRRSRIGRAAERLIADLRVSGATILRLDGAHFMVEAHALIGRWTSWRSRRTQKARFPRQFGGTDLQQSCSSPSEYASDRTSTARRKDG
jgi:hypothetical protein